jgi:hypothetical protein
VLNGAEIDVIQIAAQHLRDFDGRDVERLSARRDETGYDKKRYHPVHNFSVLRYERPSPYKSISPQIDRPVVFTDHNAEKLSMPIETRYTENVLNQPAYLSVPRFIRPADSRFQKQNKQ